MMEIGVLTARSRIQQINENFIAIFPEVCTIVENQWNFNKNDLLNAMIRTSLLLCMYSAKRNPSQSYEFTTTRLLEGQIDIGKWMSSENLGCVSKISNNSYMLLLNWPRKASQEEVLQIVKECFGNFAHIKNVQGYENPFLGFALEFYAEL